MSRITYQIASGYISQLIVVSMSLGFIPFFVDILGIRAYGLIGIYIAAQAVFSIFDIGFTNALMREMSRLYVLREEYQIKSTFKTFQWLGGAICLAILAIGICFYAINLDQILEAFNNKKHEAFAIFYAGLLLICLRVFENIYRQTLIGLNRVLLVNIVIAISAVFKGVGTYLVLKFILPSLQGYFLTNMIGSLITLVMLRIAVDKIGLFSISIADQMSAKPSINILVKVSNFSIGITIVMAITTILQQTDRIILPLKFSLEDFGYYSFSASLAAGIFYLVVPITSSVYPKLCQLAQSGQSKQAINLFSISSQFVSCLLTPIVVMAALNSRQLIYFWSNSQTLADNTSGIFAFLLIGNFFLSLAYLPSQLQFAFGRVKPWIGLLVISVCLYGALVWLFADQLGGLGVACLWCAVNAALLFFATPVTLIMLQRLMVLRWLAEGIVKPIIFPMLSMIFGWSLIYTYLPSVDAPTFIIFTLSLLLLGYLVGPFLAAPEVGKQLIKSVRASFSS